MVGTCAAALVAIWVAWLLFHPDSCSPGILVDGRKLDLAAAAKGLNLKASATPTAQAVITERLQFYLTRSSELCRDRSSGRLSAGEFVAESNQAADWYMGVLRAVQLGRLSQIAPDQADDLRGSIANLSNTAPVATLGKVTLSNSDGLLVPAGATVRNGAELKLDVATAKPTFLYVIGLGTSGRLERVFPSKLSALTNPVSGNVSIPDTPARYIGVHGAPGIERFYFFANEKADPKLEQIGEIAALGHQPADLARSLQAHIVVRDLFADPAPPAKGHPAENALSQDLRGQLGVATLEVDLNHVP